MNNPFQEQLLKAGIASKEQVQKAKQDKNKQKKKQRGKSKPVLDEAQLKIQKDALEKTKRDIELNNKKEQQAKNKAISIEIDQLIKSNCLARDEKCEITYNFDHNKKVKRIYINEDMKQQIIKGKLGIARIEGRYELVSKAVAEKIQQRNPKRIVLFEIETSDSTQNDEYADYQIPDDLMW